MAGETMDAAIERMRAGHAWHRRYATNCYNCAILAAYEALPTPTPDTIGSLRTDLAAQRDAALVREHAIRAQAERRFCAGHVHGHPGLTCRDAMTAALSAPADTTYVVLTAEQVRERDEREARLMDALREVTIGMDRAGGDADGMPECPWCREGVGESMHHAIDCALVRARAALAGAHDPALVVVNVAGAVAAHKEGP